MKNMQIQNKNQIIKLNGEVIAAKNNLMLVTIYIQDNGDFVNAIIANCDGIYCFFGFGMSIVEAFHDAIKRLKEYNMLGMVEKVNELERAYRGQE